MTMESVQAGKVRDGDPLYSDEPFVDAGNRISRIKICHAEYIESIEVFYGSKSAGQREGTKMPPEYIVEEFSLSTNEKIIEISCRYDNWIRYIAITTSKGTIKGFGKYVGEHASNCAMEGKALCFFKFIISEHLQGFFAFFAPSLYVSGPVEGPTIGPLPVQKNEFVDPALPVHAFASLSLLGNIFPSQVIKGLYGEGSIKFDHFLAQAALMKGDEWVPNIDKIAIWYTSYVEGIEITYRFESKTGKPSQTSEYKHIGTNKTEYSHYHTLKLYPDEKVTRISGRAGDVIDKIEIVTDKRGTIFSVGGSGGSEFVLDILPGKNFIAFGGETVGCLRSLFAYWT